MRAVGGEARKEAASACALLFRPVYSRLLLGAADLRRGEEVDQLKVSKRCEVDERGGRVLDAEADETFRVGWGVAKLNNAGHSLSARRKTYLTALSLSLLLYLIPSPSLSFSLSHSFSSYSFF